MKKVGSLFFSLNSKKEYNAGNAEPIQTLSQIS